MVLYATGAMDAIAGALQGFLSTLFGIPSDATASLLVGILRKDLAVGLLPVGEMTAFQTFTSVVLLTVYFPCLATFAIMLKELNWKEVLTAIGSLAAVVITLGGILHLIGIVGGLY